MRTGSNRFKGRNLQNLNSPVRWLRTRPLDLGPWSTQGQTHAADVPCSPVVVAASAFASPRFVSFIGSVGKVPLHLAHQLRLLCSGLQADRLKKLLEDGHRRLHNA